MARWLVGSLLVASALLAASPSSAEVVWRGDFETGDLSQWSRAQVVAPDRLQVVQAPVYGGSKHAMRAVVESGDNPIGASGNRNELVYLSYEPEGTERWYRWQTLWAEDYPSADTWQLFTQWHHSGSSGSPPVEFLVRGENIVVRANREVVLTVPLVRGKWFDFVFHVRWSSDPSVGFVEILIDGQVALARRPAQTQFEGQTNYLKQGLYRDASVRETGVVFHDGMVIGTTLEDVMAQPPVPPASEPPAGEQPSGEEPPAQDPAGEEPPAGGDSPVSSDDPAVPGDLGGDPASAPANGEPGSEAAADFEAQGCSASPGTEEPALLLLGLGLLLARRRAQGDAAED